MSGRYREDVRSSEPTYGLPRAPRRSRKATGHGRPLYFDQIGTNGSEDRSSSSVGDAEDAGDDLQIMLYSPGFAGTRTDPFLTYPCEVTPGVATALDHCERIILASSIGELTVLDMQIFAPGQSPVYLALGTSNPYLVWTFPLFMQNTNFFHAMLGLMQVFVEKHGQSDWKPSKEVLLHRTQAVFELRKSLEKSEGVADDAAIMTMVGLTTLDVSFLCNIWNCELISFSACSRTPNPLMNTGHTSVKW